MSAKRKTMLILFILFTLAIKTGLSNDENYIDVFENEENDILKENDNLKESRDNRNTWPFPVSENASSFVETRDGEREYSRKARIFWPYPVHIEYTNTPKDMQNNKNPLPQNPLVDLMMQTVSINHSPGYAGDPFDFLRDSYPLPKGFNEALDVYDYIIVGGGSAGSVLAARLTEDKPKAMVLLLEAGKPEMLLSDVPALQPYMQLTEYVWPYSMEHQPGVCMGSKEQRCYAPRGKALGGSSVTDYMMYSRGRPQDWNRIESMGNYGWNYDEMLKYFKKSERAELKKYKNSGYHGRDGELTVENVPFRTLLVEAFLAAGRQLGHPTVDVSAPDQFGFGYVQTIANKGHRLSAAKAFLHPHKRRKNLHIQTEATVNKVLINPQTRRAYGVEYIKNGYKYVVRCRREVILSAGPIETPKLLMLSGVGPKDHLQSLGIPVVLDLNVGKSLYDQIAFPGVIFRLNTSNISLIESKVATLPNLMQWVQFGDGLLTSSALIEAIGQIKTAVSLDPDLVPDIQLVNLGGSLTSDSGGALRKSLKLSSKMYNEAFSMLNGLDTWSAVPVLLHPKSKGYLELRDSNPFSLPKLYGNYFTDPKDMETMKEAVKHVIRIGESAPFQKFGAQLHSAKYSSCQNHVPGSDSYWECAIKTLMISTHQPVGTCRMGPPGDPKAVVDPELRVYGIEALRVVDTGILPQTMSGHSSAIGVVIAEKAADLIKKTWSNAIA